MSKEQMSPVLQCTAENLMKENFMSPEVGVAVILTSPILHPVINAL